MAADKIVVKGKYYINSTPPLALTASIFSHTNKDEEQLTLPQPFSYPLLVKANRTATILPGEGFFVPINLGRKENLVEIDPREEAPEGFVSNHLQQIKEGRVHISNMSDKPLKIRKNTPICNINKTRSVLRSYKINTKKKEKKQQKRK